jgi:acyl-CoA thioesterase I
MKYIRILFVIILSLGLIFWWWSNRSYPIVNKPSKPIKELRIVAVGDSLVEGQGATNGNDFVSLLSKRWGVSITNYGIGGNTSAQVLARIVDVTEEKPDLVILLVGGNDALQKVHTETTFANIRTIIQVLQKNGSAVVVIGVQGGLIGSTYQSKFEAVARETVLYT